MTEPDPENFDWWQTYDVPSDSWTGWEIGPLHLHARHAPGEWEFRWRRDPDPLAGRARFLGAMPTEPDAADHEAARYTLAHLSGRLELRPLLADLPVIVRPSSALHIPSKQKTTLYVTTVVWLRAFSDGSLLLDMPVFRPSDTWFGPDTVSGELCYASRTQARTRVEALAQLPHRAVTPVVISNDAETALQIEQLRVPLPFLSLYAASDGRLWTNGITLTRGADSTEASLELLGSESLPSGCSRLAEPRDDAPNRSLVRAFSRLFD